MFIKNMWSCMRNHNNYLPMKIHLIYMHKIIISKFNNLIDIINSSLSNSFININYYKPKSRKLYTVNCVYVFQLLYYIVNGIFSANQKLFCIFCLDFLVHAKFDNIVVIRIRNRYNTIKKM